MTSIVVLTYNQLEDCTKSCIKSIYEYTDKEQFELIIVDNDSQDGTKEYLKSIESKYPNIKVLLNDINKGYAGGNNDGIKASNGEYVILLNNDTLVSEGWLERLLRPFHDDCKVGLVGPISNSVGNEQRVNLDGLTEKNYNEISKRYTTLNHNVVCETQRLGFFCVAIKRNVIDTIGLLDEQFGIGMFEDDDYCLRSIQAGFKNVFVEGCFIYHKGSVSFKKLATEKYQALFQKNKAYFLSKHHVDWSYSDLLIAYFNYFETVQNKVNFEVRQNDFKNLLLFLKELEKSSDISYVESSKKELMAMSDWATQLKVSLDEKTNELSVKHNELMTMSDWACAMKLRLEKIDRHFLLRNFEKYFDGKLSIKQIIKKSVPKKWLDHYKFRKSKNQFQEALVSVRNHQKVILAFPIITWGFRFQRPQHILKELSKKGYTIIYLAMDVQPKGRLFDSIEEAGQTIHFSKLDHNIYKLWIHSYTKMNIYKDLITVENLHNMSLSIVSALKMLNIRDITYMVQFPGWSRLVFDVKSKVSGKVIFDCMDDHSGFSTNTRESLKEEHELIKKADLVIASSQLLFDKNIQLNHKTIHVKNGTEFEHFRNAQSNGKLDELAKKTIIGYYGAISDWFDMDIVEYCAKKLPDYNFVMIGSTFGCDISRVETIKNIFFLGEIPYKELPGYFAYFDVCLIPFKIIPLTLATNPVKFYEYLSAGKPVVSVELPELLAYKQYCFLANDKESFCQYIEEALAENSQLKKQERIQLAKENSWRERANMLNEGILRL
ncbi:glycosyltransferase [Sulfurospirillum sp.]|uniref:glycosyltransferase n=1 Tax=Sulfurospirillum sp. TaxID=2053622 RepID=UPI002FDE7E2D